MPNATNAEINHLLGLIEAYLKQEIGYEQFGKDFLQFFPGDLHFNNLAGYDEALFDHIREKMEYVVIDAVHPDQIDGESRSYGYMTPLQFSAWLKSRLDDWMIYSAKGSIYDD